MRYKVGNRTPPKNVNYDLYGKKIKEKKKK
jgi:hypothetical protein